MFRAEAIKVIILRNWSPSQEPEGVHPTSSSRAAEQRGARRLLGFGLPAMVGALGLYVVALQSLGWDRVADGLAALTLIVIAVVAAWATVDWFDGERYERPIVFG